MRNNNIRQYTEESISFQTIGGGQSIAWQYDVPENSSVLIKTFLNCLDFSVLEGASFEVAVGAKRFVAGNTTIIGAGPVQLIAEKDNIGFNATFGINANNTTVDLLLNGFLAQTLEWRGYIRKEVIIF